MSPHLYAVILAGGSGTRFWPLSRERFPKQLLQISGGGTLIQQTVRRVLKSVPPSRICVVTNPVQAESLQLQLEDVRGDIVRNFILEPIGRNTAPAIGFAALCLSRRDPHAVMLTLPADHIIPNVAKFTQAVSFGVTLAEAGHLVTFGIRPTRAETGYGYIQPAVRKPLGTQKGLTGYKVTRFIEKPTLAKAQEYVRQGKFLWNSGIFLWKVETVLEALSQHEPALFRGLSKVEDMLYAHKDEHSILRQYKKLKAVSIDHGIMEQSAKAAVIPVSFPWSDVGSWASLNEVSPVDKQGNVRTGNVIGVDCHNSILYGGQRLIAAIGLSDMVVVDTPDATLVCPKSRSQEVKDLVGVLKRKGSSVHLEHVTVYRPWGSYTVIEEGEGYKVKRVVVRPKGRLSLQKHFQRREHWVVIKGTARVTLGSKVFSLRMGQSVDIPIQAKHRLENFGTLPLEIIEVQNGPYLGEDDIVRFHDDYGRKKGDLHRKVGRLPI